MPQPQRLETTNVTAAIKNDQAVYWEFHAIDKEFALMAVIRVFKHGGTLEKHIWRTRNPKDAYRMHEYLLKHHPVHYLETSFRPAVNQYSACTGNEYTPPPEFAELCAALEEEVGLYWGYARLEPTGNPEFILREFDPAKWRGWKWVRIADRIVLHVQTLTEANQVHRYILENCHELLYRKSSWDGVSKMHFERTGEHIGDKNHES